jgi:single-strand DNA-binding protein
MAFSYNRAELIGRLGRDPEMRYTPEGQAVTRFSLATDRPVKPGAQPETDWHQVVCWGRLAEFAGQYLAKGRLVFVAGRLSYRSWEGNDGQTRRATEIVGREVTVLDRRPDSVPADSAPTTETNADDDVPF